MSLTDLLAELLLVIVWMVATLGLVAAVLGLVLLLTERVEAWRRTRGDKTEVEQIINEANESITRMQVAVWQARQQMREEAATRR